VSVSWWFLVNDKYLVGTLYKDKLVRHLSLLQSTPTMSSFALLAVLGVASAAKVCTNVTVPVYINARQAIFDVPTLESNLDAVKFSLDFTNIGMNYTDTVTTGFQTVTGSYNISAKYCKPQGDNKANPTVQVLTHGIGFDKSYWDLSYNNYNYSYIDVAVAAGYHTVSIDRFGIGNSSHADPLNIVQAPAEVSALHEITSMLRNGTFPAVSHKFGKVVHGKFISSRTGVFVKLTCFSRTLFRLPSELPLDRSLPWFF
jgi:hypothetical protein